MKKIRMRLGRNSELIVGIIVVVVLLGILVWDFINCKVVNTVIDIKAHLLLMTAIIVIIIIELFLEDTSCYIEIIDDKLYIKMPFRQTEVYAKKELAIRYVVKARQTKNHIAIVPCLIIGRSISDEFVFKATYKCVWKNYYFLITLNRKRFSLINAWWQKEIELPAQEKFGYYLQEGYGYAEERKNSQRFYKMIEEYNKSISDKNNAQD